MSYAIKPLREKGELQRSKSLRAKLHHSEKKVTGGILIEAS